MIRQLIIICLFLASIAVNGQNQPVVLPEPINMEGSRSMNAVMFPDSSIVISSDRAFKGFFKLYRFTYDGSKWVEQSNELIQKVNSLIYQEGELHFSFTQDYESMILTFQAGLKNSINRFFEGDLVDGNWEFYEILKDDGVNIWHAMSMSNDRKYLYGKDSEGRLQMYTRNGKSWGKPEVLDIFDDKVKSIGFVTTLGDNGLLVQAVYEEVKNEFNNGWFYTERRNDRWTAEIFFGNFSPSSLSFIPNAHEQLFDFGGEKIMRISYPDVMKAALSYRVKEEPKIVKSETPADGGKLVLPYPVNTEYNEFSPALLPDSSIMLFTDRPDSDPVLRFEYTGVEWIESPNILTTQINSMMVNKGHVHFRFSRDFRRMILLLHLDQGATHRVYEAVMRNGRWGNLREILRDASLDHINKAYAHAVDNSEMLVAPNKKPWDEFLIFQRDGESWNNSPIVSKIPDLKVVNGIVPVSNTAYLFDAQHEKSGGSYNFLVERLADGSWSAPLMVKELDVNFYDFSFTPFENYYISTSWTEHDIFISEFPDLVKNELEKSKMDLVNSVALNDERGTIKSNYSPVVKSGGQYYALLIGNSDYELDNLDLVRPAEDLRQLHSTLTENYQFESDNVILLENADRTEILNELYELRSRVSDKDNLLIFYAGHGFWDDDVRQGYWWPTDANPDNPGNWLSNSDLKEQIRGINSAHTLLISDACFSGGIFKTRGAEEITKAGLDIQLLYRMPSRRAITSGTLSTVPDNSVFFEYLNKYLVENPKKFISSSELFDRIRTSVLNNSLTVPQDGVIMETGDEGGDFIFIRRDN